MPHSAADAANKEVIMVTRVRVDAEGSTRDEVEQHLNAVFQLLFQNSVASQYTFTGPSYTSQPYGPTPVVPRDSEFIEEVYESQITEHGAIRWKGRRVMRFIENIMAEAIGFGSQPFLPPEPSPNQSIQREE